MLETDTVSMSSRISSVRSELRDAKPYTEKGASSKSKTIKKKNQNLKKDTSFLVMTKGNTPLQAEADSSKGSRSNLSTFNYGATSTKSSSRQLKSSIIKMNFQQRNLRAIGGHKRVGSCDSSSDSVSSSSESYFDGYSNLDTGSVLPTISSNPS